MSTASSHDDPFSPEAERAVSERIQTTARHGINVPQQHPAVNGVTADFWDELYGSKSQMWSGTVNHTLARLVAEVAPGSALDLGCGEGGDALWLASRGWQVTAVDISAVALARAEAAAANAGLAGRIDWQLHDLELTFPDGVYDLVSAQFLQTPLPFERAQTLRRAAAAVAPGGLLVIVGHAAMPAWSTHTPPEGSMPSPQEVLDGLELNQWDWAVERAEVVERPGVGPDGEHGELLDSVVVARRLA